MQSDTTRIDNQSELEARHDGLTRDLPESASKGNRSLRENILELRAQYDQEVADLWYECDGLQSRPATMVVAVKRLTSLNTLPARV